MRRAWKRLLRSFLSLLNLPLFEIGLAQHGHGGAHLEMAETAQLRTRYLENAQLIGLEVHRDFHPRDDILLLAQLRDEEVVDHVPGMHQEVDRLADRHFERRTDDVVLAGRIFFVKAEGIPGGIVDQLQIGVAKFAVGSGIAEAPCELFAQNFDRNGVRRGLVEMDAGPVPLEIEFNNTRDRFLDRRS